MYTRETEHNKVIMIIWVDDLIIADMLTARFKMMDLGKLGHFLGIDFNQSDKSGSTWWTVSQDPHRASKN